MLQPPDLGTGALGGRRRLCRGVRQAGAGAHAHAARRGAGKGEGILLGGWAPAGDRRGRRAGDGEGARHRDEAAGCVGLLDAVPGSMPGINTEEKGESTPVESGSRDGGRQLRTATGERRTAAAATRDSEMGNGNRDNACSLPSNDSVSFF